jgi:MFS transporter, PAT family, beta-lactamase induction signal transducer AmpG
MARPRIAPVWLIGLSMSPFGFYSGILFYAIPQLLAARHVPEERIAGLSGLLLAPYSLFFLIAPILDVRFSRRFYATVCCALATATLIPGLFNQDSLPLLAVLMFVGATFMSLFSAALGGWLASVIPGDRQPELSSWMNVANIGAGGLMAFLSVRLIRYFPLPLAAGLLASMVMLPLSIFLFIPAPGPDRRLARESFSGLMHSIASLFRRGEVILVLLLFALPSSSFSLTNLLPGLGGDFHTPERTVSLINGVGVTLAGIAASLLGGPLCARLPLRRLYLGIGIAGGLFTLSLLLLPHRPTAFAVATIGQNGFQALAFTVMTALVLRTVGHGNALAATEYGILICAANLPIVYMQFIDGHAYTLRGVPGAFMTDAGISITVCAVLLGLLAWLRMRAAGKVEAVALEAAD